MKISVGRSGKDIGDYELEDVRSGLARGLFLESDYGWYPGMAKWLPVLSVIQNLDQVLHQKKKKVPVEKGWRAEKPTPRQLKMLKRSGVAIPTGLNRGRASDLIAELPEPFKRFTTKELELLKAEGIDLARATMTQCHLLLEKLK